MPLTPHTNPDNGPNWPGSSVWALLAAFVVIVLFGSLLVEPNRFEARLPYSTVKTMIREGEVQSVELREHVIVVTTGETDAGEVQVVEAVVPAQGDPELLKLLEDQGIEITAIERQGVSIFTYMLPWILILGVYLWLQRRMMGSMGVSISRMPARGPSPSPASP